MEATVAFQQQQQYNGYVRLPPHLQGLHSHKYAMSRMAIPIEDLTAGSVLATFPLQFIIEKNGQRYLEHELILSTRMLQLARTIQKIVKNICNYKFDKFQKRANQLMAAYLQVKSWLSQLDLIHDIKIDEIISWSHNYYFRVQHIHAEEQDRMYKFVYENHQHKWQPVLIVLTEVLCRMSTLSAIKKLNDLELHLHKKIMITIKRKATYAYNNYREAIQQPQEQNSHRLQLQLQQLQRKQREYLEDQVLHSEAHMDLFQQWMEVHFQEKLSQYEEPLPLTKQCCRAQQQQSEQQQQHEQQRYSEQQQHNYTEEQQHYVAQQQYGEQQQQQHYSEQQQQQHQGEHQPQQPQHVEQQQQHISELQSSEQQPMEQQQVDNQQQQWPQQQQPDIEQQQQWEDNETLAQLQQLQLPYEEWMNVDSCNQ